MNFECLKNIAARRGNYTLHLCPLAVCVPQESRSLLLGDLRLAQEEGFCFGVKLVRGAYMDKERKLAKEEGREDPVNQSWENTNDRWSPESCL